MLTSTFLHAPTIGPGTERSLWRQGALDWDLYLDDTDKWKISSAQKEFLTPVIEESCEAYINKDPSFFASLLPSTQRWRAFNTFEGSVGYLDIETNGGMQPTSITMIGLYIDGEEETYTLVKRQSLHLFPELIKKVKTIVTFNGNSFDIPMLKKAYPNVRFDEKIHIDLCPVLRKLGYRGGLKAIELQRGIHRSSLTEGLTGWDAVLLWQQYRAGDEDALEKLIKYNTEDVINMQPLMRFAYKEMCKVYENYFRLVAK